MRIIRILLTALAFCFLAAAQSASLMPVPKIQFLNAEGVPVDGGFVYTYAAGTTTPLVTYTDASGSTPNADPVVLDSGGFANIWLGANTYKIVLQDKHGVQIWSVDNVSNPGQIQSACAGQPNCFVKLDANGFVPQAELNYNEGGTAAVNRTVQSRLQDFVSVKDFGAKGDGATDDTAAIQAALNYAISAGRSLYLPDGTYLTSSMLTAYIGADGITIKGQSEIKTILYCQNCTGTQEAVLRIASDAAATQFAGPVNLSEFTIWGTTATTYALELNNPTWGTLDNVAPGPAVSACLYVTGGVGMTYKNVLIDSNHTGGWIGGMHPRAGWILDRSALSQSTTSTLVTPTIQGMDSGDSAIALELKDTQHIVITGAQITENDINLQIDSNSLNNSIIGGLFELAVGNGDTIINGPYNKFIGNVFTGPVMVDAANVFTRNEFAAAVTINAGATSGSVFEDSQVSSAATFVDNSGDTVFKNTNYYSEGGQWAYDFPATQQVLKLPTSRFGSSGPAYSPVYMRGVWEVSTAAAPVTISPRAFVTGKAWKMLLIGVPLSSGLPIDSGSATQVELTDVDNVMNLDATHSVTFSVNSSGFLQMSEAADHGPVGFAGEIIFLPTQSTAGTETELSTDYSAIAKSVGVQIVNGTEPTCDFTHSGLLWFIRTDATTKDDLQWCNHGPVDNYGWSSVITGNQALPTVAVGAGAGTGATASLAANSTSYSGLLTVTTGTTPTVSSSIATVTFNHTLNKTPACVVSPSIDSSMSVVVSPRSASNASWQLWSSSTGLTASTVYQWSYVCL